MNIVVQILIISLVSISGIWCECDVCQSTNFVACHEQNVFSLCVNGSATNDYIRCPKNYVCTIDPYVCYPVGEAKPSCKRVTNRCGVCNEKKVYACINETTIAFCYGQNWPVEGAEVSYCLNDTVCDINSQEGFCSRSSLVEPSCVTFENKTVDTITKMFTPTTETTTTTTSTTTETVEPSTEGALTTAPTTTELATPTTNTESTPTSTTLKVITTPGPTTPDEICEFHGETGSFPMQDATCTTFVVCYLMGGSITGIRKKCPKKQYFSPITKSCSSIKPDVCD